MILQGKRIFIVEDNSMNRVVYQMVLRRHGAILEFDRLGIETLAKIKEFKPDLIVMDLMLGAGGSGFDTFSRIRQNPEYSHIPVVAISASEPAVAIPKCKQYGFNGFIAKPVDDETLPEQLVQLVRGEEVWYAGERYGG